MIRKITFNTEKGMMTGELTLVTNNLAHSYFSDHPEYLDSILNLIRRELQIQYHEIKLREKENI